MIVDTSVIIAIFENEPETALFTATIKAAQRPRMSTASYVEASLRLGRSTDTEGARDLDGLLARLGIVLEPLTVEHALAARAAGERFGRGHHPARLNFGDCCTYALAKVSDEPLLFKGDDFSRTDLVAALP